MKKILSNILLFLMFFQANAQKESVSFEKLTLEDGLSQSTVNCILQDKNGFMWFGTLDGLNKYDGYNFSVFRNKLEDKNSITDNTITALCEDSRGFLWIGTKSKGISIYNKLNNQFITPEIKSNNPLDSEISHIAEDIDGNMWIGTGNGIIKVKITIESIKTKRFTTIHELTHNKVNYILPDEAGNVWIATGKGLARYNVYSKELKAIRTLNAKSTASINQNINTLSLDENNILWLGTNKGIIKFYKSSLIARKFKDEYKINNLNKLKINTLLHDKNGMLWIGTHKNGLFKFSKNKVLENFENNPSDNKSISVNEILSIYSDKSGIIWIGTSLGGINKRNKQADKIKVYKHNSYDDKSLSSNLIRTIYQDKNKILWIGTVNGGLNKWERKAGLFIDYKNKPDNNKSLSNNHVRAIFEDEKGNFWIGTDGGGLNLMNRKTETFECLKNNKTKSNSISSNKIWDINSYKDKLLIATFGGGLNIFNYEENSFKALKTDSLNPNSISDNRVTCIYKDSKSNIWVGTYGGGLNLFIPDTETFHRFKFDKNNPYSIGNDRVYSIYEDTNNDLWIGTKGSLNKYNPNENNFTRYTEKNGLPNDVIIGILEDNNKNLWISTNKGICRFNLETHKIKNYDVNDGLQSNEFLVGAYCKTHEGELLFGGISGFNAFRPERMKGNTNTPQNVITGFKVLNKEIKFDTVITEKKHIVLDWNENNISFEFVSIDYTLPEKNQYSYRLKGFEKKWNKVNNRRFASYTNLPYGEYEFTVKGSNNDGKWNNTGKSIKLTIKPAFWQTTLFRILVAFFLLTSIILFIKHRLKVLKSQENELNRLVNIRTNEISEKKNKIARQIEQINFQKQEIIDSIMYAKKIEPQVSGEFFNKKSLKDYFIYTKSKEKINSNFYWIRRKANNIVIAIVDSDSGQTEKNVTNRIIASVLNNTIQKYSLPPAGILLSGLVKKIENAIKDNKLNVTDLKNIEIGICIINPELNFLEFAGANSPLYYIRDNKLNIIDGNNKRINFRSEESAIKDFKTKKINTISGDTFYMFTNGYAKQFGGNEGVNFLYRRFRDFLVHIHSMPMENQKKLLDKNIIKWKKNYDLEDDIIIIGFSV